VNPPAGASIAYSLARTTTSPVTVTVADSAGDVVTTLGGPPSAGIHKLIWPAPTPGRSGAGRMVPGAYRVTLTVDGVSYTRSLTVLDDQWFKARP
jgi:hypothetical protein